jgi:hypothetical protein
MNFGKRHLPLLHASIFHLNASDKGILVKFGALEHKAWNFL